jgi:hypothetical protein
MEYNSFIYLWIDKQKNKFYIGSHFGDINDGYLFGGIDIKSEYSKRPEDFERVILSYHIVKSQTEIRKIEREYLVKYDVENDDRFYTQKLLSYSRNFIWKLKKMLLLNLELKSVLKCWRILIDYLVQVKT